MFFLHNIQKLFVFSLVFSLISCSPTIKVLDKQFNRVDFEPPLFCTKDNPCQEAEQFHKTLFIPDLNADSLLLGRDLSEKSDKGLVNFLRLRQGNVSLRYSVLLPGTPLQEIIRRKFVVRA